MSKREEIVKDFEKDRARLQEKMLKNSGIVAKRFLSLDSQAYREDALDSKTKEMLGLVASLVLRCDDCIRYHLQRCWEEGVSTEELDEVLSIGLVVGGSITIPHIRRAWEFWEELNNQH